MISDRVENIRIKHGLTKKEMSARLEVTEQSYNNYFKGKRQWPTDKIIKLKQLFNVSIDWVLTGDGMMYEQEVDLPIFAHNTDACNIPYYDVQASAGNGSFVEDENLMGYQAVRKEWIKKKSFDQFKLCFIDVKGDSMEPTLLNKDLIMLNMQSITLKDGAIFVLQYDNRLIVKRIQTQLDKSILIKSDNLLYSTEVLAPNKEHNIKVIGEVVWYGRDLT